MSPKEIAEALCREADCCTLCSLHRVCNMVDPELMPCEMEEDRVNEMMAYLPIRKETNHAETEN